jgi:signal transduction histidine kinase
MHAGCERVSGGLQGIRDRADAAGGHLTLASPVGGPTIVTADLPIHGYLGG